MATYGFAEWEATPHLWGALAPGIPDDHPIQEQFTENILSFVKRHNLTLVMSQWRTTPADVASLEERLELAASHDIDVWLGTYDLRKYTDKELITDQEKLKDDLERLDRVVDTYTDYYPAGNVFLWHESPLTGQWTGTTRAEKADSMMKCGPELFAAQKRSIISDHPELDVGIFIHQPFLAPPEYTDKPIFGPIMSQLEGRDALPDFTYFDMYRYHFDWDVGYEATNDYLRAIFENIDEHTNGRPIYYLADFHSHDDNRTNEDINPDGQDAYTPCKQALLGHLRTARDAGAEAFGWYIGKNYPSESSERNYNPFVPECGSIYDEDTFNSITGSRDRFIWATLALLERTSGINSQRRFDLWLNGHDFNLFEHRLQLRTTEGNWEFVTDFGGYPDGEDYRYGGCDRDWTTVIHALDRGRFVDDTGLQLRITTRDDSGESLLKGVYVMPHLDSSYYLTEEEITALVTEVSGVERYALGTNNTDTVLSPRESLSTQVSIAEPDESIMKLSVPSQRVTLAALAEWEAQSDHIPSELFDLWLYGTDVETCSVAINGQPLASSRSDQDTHNENRDALVFRGLEREEFFAADAGGTYCDLAIDGDGQAEVAAVYVMPYHGTANFISDMEVASIVADDYHDGEGQLTTFALGHQFWPAGARPSLKTPIQTRVRTDHRRINGFTAFERE